MAPAAGPKVDAAALAGTRLVFVSSGGLWEVDGGQLIQVAAPSGYAPSHPVFSADGKWLAFIETSTGTSGSAAGSAQLWLASADGRSAAAVHSVTDPETIAWSPTGAEILVTTSGANGPAEVQVVQPSGSVSTLGSGLVATAAWSPDGSQVGMSITNHEATGFTSVVEVTSPTGGLPTVWHTDTQDVLEVAAWWSGWGIAYWDDPQGSASIAADGLPLDALAGPGQSAHQVAETLVRSDWLDPGPGTEVALVGGGDRVEWDGKTVATCTPYTCTSVPEPSGTVTVDPALSGHGTLAYVEGSASQSFDSGPSQVAAWEDGHTLWTLAPGSKTPTEVQGALGANAPQWSADGQQILFVRDGSLYLIPAAGGKAVEVATPLTEPTSYYGQVEWLTQFVWSSG